MKVFLDSAVASAWTLPAGCPPVQGVTTNPTLVRQAGLPVTLDSYTGLLHAAADAGLAELMLQLPHPDAEEALRWLEPLQKTAADAAISLLQGSGMSPEMIQMWTELFHQFAKEGTEHP